MQTNRSRTTLTIEFEHDSFLFSKADVRNAIIPEIQKIIDPLVNDGCSGVKRVNFSISEDYVNITSPDPKLPSLQDVLNHEPDKAHGNTVGN